MATKNGASQTTPLLGGRPQGAEGGRSPGSASGGRPPNNGAPGDDVVPDPEVPAKATRRRFTAAYKLSIIEQADACTEAGELGALLRREGLYSSHLSEWRKAKKAGALRALSPKKRGRKRREEVVSAREYRRLQRELELSQSKLEKAEIIISVQKKLSKLLGIELPPDTRDERSD